MEVCNTIDPWRRRSATPRRHRDIAPWVRIPVAPEIYVPGGVWDQGPVILEVSGVKDSCPPRDLNL
jgi:hypothetical protein